MSNSALFAGLDNCGIQSDLILAWCIREHTSCYALFSA